MRSLCENWVNFLLSLSFEYVRSGLSQVLRVEWNPLSWVNCRHQWNSICYRWFLFPFDAVYITDAFIQNIERKMPNTRLVLVMWIFLIWHNGIPRIYISRLRAQGLSFVICFVKQHKNKNDFFFFLLPFSACTNNCCLLGQVPSCNYKMYIYYSIAAFAFWLPYAARM